MAPTHVKCSETARIGTTTTSRGERTAIGFTLFTARLPKRKRICGVFALLEAILNGSLSKTAKCAIPRRLGREPSCTWLARVTGLDLGFGVLILLTRLPAESQLGSSSTHRCQPPLTGGCSL